MPAFFTRTPLYALAVVAWGGVAAAQVQVINAAAVNVSGAGKSTATTYLQGLQAARPNQDAPAAATLTSVESTAWAAGAVEGGALRRGAARRLYSVATVLGAAPGSSSLHQRLARSVARMLADAMKPANTSAISIQVRRAWGEGAQGTCGCGAVAHGYGAGEHGT